MRFDFDDDGVLHLSGREEWREPICPICHKPIQWVLDMASFTSLSQGSHRLAHARCVWLPDAFSRQAALSRRALADAPASPS